MNVKYMYECPLIGQISYQQVACKQVLQGALTLATTSLEVEFHLQFPRGSPSTELSDLPNQRKAERPRM